MFITYGRSSSLGAYKLCPHQFFLFYNLGIEHRVGIKAAIGNSAHKALELLALRKVAEQNGETAFESEDFGLIENIKLTPDKASQLGFNHYRKLEPWHDWQDSDYLIVKKYVNNTLTYNDGEYSPLKREVVAAEQHFELEMAGPQFHYKYQLPDQTLEGQLRIRGTLDLVLGVDEETIEVQDLKSGKMSAFPMSHDKTEKDYLNDTQFLLYYYATRRIYPHIRNVLFTVFYCQFNKPVTIPFGDKDMGRAEEMIATFFKKIKNDTKPQVKPGWYCKICTAAKPYQDTGMSMCEYFQKEVKKRGTDAIFIERDAVKLLGNYTGGGRTQ